MWYNIRRIKYIVIFSIIAGFCTQGEFTFYFKQLSYKIIIIIRNITKNMLSYFVFGIWFPLRGEKNTGTGVKKLLSLQNLNLRQIKSEIKMIKLVSNIMILEL